MLLWHVEGHLELYRWHIKAPERSVVYQKVKSGKYVAKEPMSSVGQWYSTWGTRTSGGT
jgi:hypothetical protein